MAPRKTGIGEKAEKKAKVEPRKSKAAAKIAKKKPLPTENPTKKENSKYRSNTNAYANSFRKVMQDWALKNCDGGVRVDAWTSIQNKRRPKTAVSKGDPEPTLVQYLGWLDSLKDRDEASVNNTSTVRYWDRFCDRAENKKMVTSWKMFARDCRTLDGLHEFKPDFGQVDFPAGPGGRLHPLVSFPDQNKFTDMKDKLGQPNSGDEADENGGSSLTTTARHKAAARKRKAESEAFERLSIDSADSQDDGDEEEADVEKEQQDPDADTDADEKPLGAQLDGNMDSDDESSSGSQQAEQPDQRGILFTDGQLRQALQDIRPKPLTFSHCFSTWGVLKKHPTPWDIEEGETGFQPQKKVKLDRAMSAPRDVSDPREETKVHVSDYLTSRNYSPGPPSKPRMGFRRAGTTEPDGVERGWHLDARGKFHHCVFDEVMMEPPPIPGINTGRGSRFSRRSDRIRRATPVNDEDDGDDDWRLEDHKSHDSDEASENDEESASEYEDLEEADSSDDQEFIDFIEKDSVEDSSEDEYLD